MRSPFSFSASKETLLAVGSAGQGRDRLRRKLLGIVSIIIGGVSALALPFAVYALVHGVTLPFGLTALGLGAGMAGLARGKQKTIGRTVHSGSFIDVIDHSGHAVLRFADNGTVLTASPASETLFGCQSYELGDANLNNRVHVADRPLYLTGFADASRGGKARVVEVRMRQDDPLAGGNVPKFIWVEVSLFPVSDSMVGERHEVVALLRDITERKDSEASMIRACRVAEEASVAKSRLLATIGHEFGTPLNAVVGFSEMMTAGIGGTLSDTHRDYAGLIHQSGKHLLEVTRMLLDVSGLEAGKLHLQTRPFHLQDIVAPCIGMLTVAAGKRDIKLVTEIGKDLPLLVGDERACRQILINLLSNAIKFSHPGGTVVVTLKRQGTSLNLSVRDQGIGMAPESLERIGEAFFQARRESSVILAGSGLGLCIVKGLVDLHEGTLRAMSEIGAGTSVTVLLPINGPAINYADTATVTPIRKTPSPAPQSSWQDEKRKAQ